MKSTFIKLSILLLFYDCITALIIPEEVPTILSLIYSNIPPIKKGTDSRVGVGFRLGEHADFQILVELGPQKETDPIGNVESKRRRMATYSAAMRGEMGPWAQSVAKYQTELKLRKELERRQLEDKLSETEIVNGNKIDRKKATSNDWLEKWSKGAMPTDEKDSSARLTTNRPITLKVKNDQRSDKRADETTSVGASEDVDDKIANLQKLFKQQPAS